MRNLLGGDRRGRGPPRDGGLPAASWAAVLAVVVSLADLVTIAPRARDRVVGAPRAWIRSPNTSVTVRGRVGPIDDAVGRDLDTVCVVGMAEAAAGAGPTGSLLPEGAVEPSAPEQLDERYRVLQLALAAGSTHRLCSFPRGSMRGGGDRIPSRWLLPTLTRLAGTEVHATRWQEAVAECPTVTAVPSFVDGILTPPPVLGPDPATAAELRIRALAGPPWRVGADSPELLVRAHQVRTDRGWAASPGSPVDVSAAADLLTVLDRPLFRPGSGLGPEPVPVLSQHHPAGPTLDDPADAIEMDLATTALVHAILQRYVDDRIETGSRTGPGPADVRARRSGCRGRSVSGLVASLWRRRELLPRRARPVVRPGRGRRRPGLAPHATELDFGQADGASETVEIPYVVTTSTGTTSLLLVARSTG